MMCTRVLAGTRVGIGVAPAPHLPRCATALQGAARPAREVGLGRVQARARTWSVPPHPCPAVAGNGRAGSARGRASTWASPQPTPRASLLRQTARPAALVAPPGAAQLQVRPHQLRAQERAR
eukprot:scaffold297291_cov32-Tisochrysis_lutea.AAC.4